MRGAAGRARPGGARPAPTGWTVIKPRPPAADTDAEGRRRKRTGCGRVKRRRLGDMGDCDIERFIFPDGTERDLLVFEHDAATPCPLTTPAPATPREAHICPLCRSPLVHPTDGYAWVRLLAHHAALPQLRDDAHRHAQP